MKSLVEESVLALGSAIDRFPWEQRAAYGDWLAQTYYYVRHSTRLLAAAAARFPCDARGDALHARFSSHMGEEKKHERLCLHDLLVLGRSLDDHPERPSTRMFYEPQYYKIEHEDPTALFGYILPLEAIGPARGRAIAATVRAAYGEKCASFLSLHAADDVYHLEKAFALVGDLPERPRRLVEANLRQTTYAYVAMMDDMRFGVSERSRDRAIA